jgi:F-type H+-transporting ATPase subunit a
VYPDATLPLTSAELANGVIPYVFTVTPYVRGATTDLNLTLALAFISVVAIQVFGTIAQGPNYWQKYVNLIALGNLKKRPLGAVDFIVGLFEIISELGKLISLSFRLFGNMFAGGILLAVMAFLIALILPSIFLGLEVIVTTIQALVFAILTLVFSAQAMEGHHGEEGPHDEHGDVESDGAHIAATDTTTSQSA